MAQTHKDKQYGYTTWAVKGYEQACEKHGIPLHWRTIEADMDNAKSVVLDLLDEVPEITAVITRRKTGSSTY